ncbi:MAG: O-antigen ligase family protein [Acidobacteria bacterium]|nr:O-antigen ligase family protein [Acidobacteriota bacterium]
MRKVFLPAIIILVISLAVSFGIAKFSPKVVLLSLFGIAIALLALVKTEYAIYLLILSMLLSPEFAIAPAAGGGSLEASRQLIVRLDDILILLIGLSWLAKTAFYKELGLFLKTPLNRPIFAYISICFLSTFLGGLAGRLNLKLGLLYVLKYVEYFLIYFMVVNNLDSERKAKRFIFIAFLTAFLIAIFAISQIPSGERVTAPFEGKTGEPNTLGGYLLFMIALAGGIFLTTGSSKERFRWGIFALVLIVPFLYTLSRTSWLAALPAAIVFLILSDKRIPVLFLLIFLVVGLVIFAPSKVRKRIDYTFNQPPARGQIQVGGVKLDTSASARIRSWRFGLNGWTKHPLFGYGVTGFAFMDAQYIRTLVETGLVGFFIFLYLLFRIYREAIKVYRKLSSPFYRGIVMGYIAGFVGLIFHGIGANTFIIIRIMEPFWLFTAIVIMLPDLLRPTEKRPDLIL